MHRRTTDSYRSASFARADASLSSSLSSSSLMTNAVGGAPAGAIPVAPFARQAGIKTCSEPMVAACPRPPIRVHLTQRKMVRRVRNPMPMPLGLWRKSTRTYLAAPGHVRRGLSYDVAIEADRYLELIQSIAGQLTRKDGAGQSSNCETPRTQSLSFNHVKDQ